MLLAWSSGARQRARALLWRALPLFALGLASCSSDDSADNPTCPARAAFELSVRAVPGPLPPDTLVHVEYNGGVEDYRLSDASHAQEVVLCNADADADAGDADEVGDASESDAGESDAALGVASLHCALWTQGAATVTVTGGGLTVVKELKAQAKNKCIVTLPVDVVLGDQDAAL